MELLLRHLFLLVAKWSDLDEPSHLCTSSSTNKPTNKQKPQNKHPSQQKLVIREVREKLGILLVSFMIPQPPAHAHSHTHTFTIPLVAVNVVVAVESICDTPTTFP